MQQYYGALTRNGFDSAHAFALCDDADLQVCEVALLGHRKLLLALAARHRAEVFSPPIASSPITSSASLPPLLGRSRAATFHAVPGSPSAAGGARRLRAQPSSATTISAVPVVAAPLTYSQNFWTRARAREVPWDFDVPVFEDAEAQPKLRIFLVRHGQCFPAADHELLVAPLGFCSYARLAALTDDQFAALRVASYDAATRRRLWLAPRALVYDTAPRPLIELEADGGLSLATTYAHRLLLKRGIDGLWHFETAEQLLRDHDHDDIYLLLHSSLSSTRLRRIRPVASQGATWCLDVGGGCVVVRRAGGGVASVQGNSVANIDHELYKSMADHAIPLSPLGERQAVEAGRSFRKFLARQGDDEQHVRLWTSVYKRARQTAHLFRSGAGDCITDMREDVLLGEQQWGLFEGYDWKGHQISADFPSELSYYRKATEHGGRFWAKVPLGESRFDVCMRVKLFLGTLFRDAYRHGITNVVIVSHGVTIRAFMMMFLHLSPEWLEVEPNPKNASIRVIENCMDAGYIWSGPEHPRPDLLVNPTAVDHVDPAAEQLATAADSPRLSVRRNRSAVEDEFEKDALF